MARLTNVLPVTGTLRLSALVVGVLCQLAAPASAQSTTSPRVYRGLFGPGEDAASRGSRAGLMLALFGGYDNNLIAKSGRPSSPEKNVGGWLGGTRAQGEFRRVGRSGSFELLGGALFRYYPEVGEMTAGSYQVSVSGSRQLGSRTSVQANQYLYYEPYYAASLLSNPEEPPPVGTVHTEDYAVTARNSVGSLTGVTFAYRLGQRTTTSAHYGYRYSAFEDGELRLSGHQLGAELSHRLTRYASARFRYSIRRYTRELDLEPTSVHDVGVGLDYSRPWSLVGRRTTFVMRPALSLLERQQSGTRIRLGGTVNLSHDIGRSWTLQAYYDRGVRFIQRLDGPTAAESAGVVVGGFLHRRVEAVGTVKYGTGSEVIGTVDRTGYDALSYVATVRTALTRHLAAYGEYFYYRYGFRQDVELPGGVGREVNRHGFRLGLNVWAPVWP